MAEVNPPELRITANYKHLKEENEWLKFQLSVLRGELELVKTRSLGL